MTGDSFAVCELSLQNWADFETLMKSDGQCRECWCLNHRVPSGTAATGDAAKVEMKALVARAAVGGLLAYSQQECVGWISIDAMASLSGHDCQGAGRFDEWAIHCVFVKDGFRGLGVSRLLIRHAVEYALSKGAKRVTAYPIPAASRAKFPKDVAEFSGRESTFQGLGFVRTEAISDFYVRYELIQR